LGVIEEVSEYGYRVGTDVAVSLTGSTNWISLSELLGFSIWTTDVSSLLGVISVVTKDDVDFKTVFAWRTLYKL
jgi:hypothetical protein